MLDMQGSPVRGAKLRVGWIGRFSDGGEDAETYLGPLEKPLDAFPSSAVSNADGRFARRTGAVVNV